LKFWVLRKGDAISTDTFRTGLDKILFKCRPCRDWSHCFSGVLDLCQLSGYGILSQIPIPTHRNELDAGRSHPTEVCIFLGDWWFWGPCVFMMTLLVSKLYLELSRLNDRTNLASEISETAFTWLVGAGECQSSTQGNCFGGETNISTQASCLFCGRNACKYPRCHEKYHPRHFSSNCPSCRAVHNRP